MCLYVEYGSHGGSQERRSSAKKRSAMPLLNIVLAATGLALGARDISCPQDAPALVFSDQHDGDFKSVEIKSGMLTIKPYNNTESWLIQAGPLSKGCAATLNFSVPGKPNPPPVPLLFTIGVLQFFGDAPVPPPSGDNWTPIGVFTDPSGTIGGKTQPLNTWFGLGKLAA